MRRSGARSTRWSNAPRATPTFAFTGWSRSRCAGAACSIGPEHAWPRPSGLRRDLADRAARPPTRARRRRRANRADEGTGGRAVVAEPADALLPRPRRPRRGLEATWQRLRDAGFHPTGDPELYSAFITSGRSCGPDSARRRIHHQPKWIEDAVPPTAELLRTGGSSATGVPGLLALEPARHAVVLAVHAWAHVPLGRLGRLIDVAALARAPTATSWRGSPAPGASSGSGARPRPRSTRSSAITAGGRSSATSGRGICGVFASGRCWNGTSSAGSARSRRCRRRRLLPPRAGISPISSPGGRRDTPADDQALRQAAADAFKRLSEHDEITIAKHTEEGS